jgi:hypothetical protein
MVEHLATNFGSNAHRSPDLRRQHNRSHSKSAPGQPGRPFISIVGHITADELRQALDHTSMANGSANRVCLRQAQQAAAARRYHE